MNENSSGARIRVAINGCGRIGRAFLRLAFKEDDFEIVGINDLSDIENIAYLLNYDTVYGKSGLDVKADLQKKSLIIKEKTVPYFSEKDPQNLPWGDLKVDVVIEATGIFTDYEKANIHLSAGAKKVLITAPAKGEVLPGGKSGMSLVGLNEENIKACDISSNASCTTNASSPLIAILDEKIGIEKAILNTIHAYTASQTLVDGPSKKDFRAGRAGAQNIIPSSTGAALAITKVLPILENKFDGIAIRVPVVSGSLVDITFIAKRNTTKEEVNEILKTASLEPRWSEFFAVSEEELVSSDIIGETKASIADLKFTKVVDGNLVKVLAWYDNEIGYANTLILHSRLLAENLQK